MGPAVPLSVPNQLFETVVGSRAAQRSTEQPRALHHRLPPPRYPTPVAWWSRSMEPRSVSARTTERLQQQASARCWNVRGTCVWGARVRSCGLWRCVAARRAALWGLDRWLPQLAAARGGTPALPWSDVCWPPRAAASKNASKRAGYDFALLTALSPIISKVFFPKESSQAVQQLAFWCAPKGAGVHSSSPALAAHVTPDQTTLWHTRLLRCLMLCVRRQVRVRGGVHLQVRAWRRGHSARPSVSGLRLLMPRRALPRCPLLLQATRQPDFWPHLRRAW
jgi:hypothetical protein